MIDTIRWFLFLPEEGSTVATEIDRLHAFIISITMLGATGVFAAGVFCVVRWKTRGRLEPTKRFEGPLWFEVLTIGGMLAIFLTWWVLGFRQFIRVTAPEEGALEIYVVAKQWVWEFDYPNGQTSLRTLYLPADRPVRLIITSRDVIHSFFVPAFRLKMDAVPGRYTILGLTAREGEYEVLCAQYCGASHSLMRGEVRVLSPGAYDAWLRGNEPAKNADLVALGRTVAAQKGCLLCHSLDGSRAIGPTWKDLYGAEETLATGEKVLVDGAYVTEFMIEPNAKIVAGYAPIMPSFRGRIEPAETAAIVELMRSISRHAERVHASSR